MSKVLAALPVSVDGFITGRGSAPGVTHLHYRVIR